MSYDAWQKKGSNKKKDRQREKERVRVRDRKYIYVKREACAHYNNILKIELNC